ncbi:hypothetical protein Trydic_g13647 [Trypoxylus dichotomus]
MKETYENFNILLEKIKHEDCFGNICADIKVFALQGSRDKKSHRIKQNWKLRRNLIPRRDDVHQPSPEEGKVTTIPPPHVQLRHVKDFVKLLDHGFHYQIKLLAQEQASWMSMVQVLTSILGNEKNRKLRNISNEYNPSDVSIGHNEGFRQHVSGQMESCYVSKFLVNVEEGVLLLFVGGNVT